MAPQWWWGVRCIPSYRSADAEAVGGHCGRKQARDGSQREISDGEGRRKRRLFSPRRTRRARRTPRRAPRNVNSQARGHVPIPRRVRNRYVYPESGAAQPRAILRDRCPGTRCRFLETGIGTPARPGAARCPRQASRRVPALVGKAPRDRGFCGAATADGQRQERTRFPASPLPTETGSTGGSLSWMPP